MDRNKKKASEWFVILLIILFFTIPVYTLAVMNEGATLWPKCPSSFVYNLVFK
jgi:hypothetical protein